MSSSKYIRIGTTYYKLVAKPLLNGEQIQTRVPWRVETIRQDHGKEFLANIPKYDAFCVLPSHTDWQQKVGSCYNLYDAFEHIPEKGDCVTIVTFLTHIFGEQLELGLDYLQLLYLKPLQKLPILLLVSQERNTGKTTFLNFLKTIFGKNMTFNTNESFRSQFNSDWSNKLIIAVDEVLLDKKEDSERIKNLSTSLSHKSEAKGKDRSEINFFGKFILCSNNEQNPILIQPYETRYWVRKVPCLEKDDIALLDKMKKEIPAFLAFLRERELSTQQSSRMWFAPYLLRTNALLQIMNFSRNPLEVELREVVMDLFDKVGINELHFCLSDLLTVLHKEEVKINRTQLRKILQYSWHLTPVANSLTYITYCYVLNNYNRANLEMVKRVGRHYTLTKEFLTSFF